MNELEEYLMSMTGEPVTERPVNGHGHPRSAISGPLPALRDVGAPSSPWPPRREPAPEEPSRHRRERPSRHPSWRAPDAGTVIRWASWLAVLAVSAIAAVISYSHIYALAFATHEHGTDARLLPLSVDGLILASSLTLLDAARRDVKAPVMAYLMLVLGVGATIAANVEYGMPWGWKSSVVAAWPAVAFIGSVEVALRMTRSRRRVAGERGRWLSWPRRAARVKPDSAVAPPPAVATPPSPAIVKPHAASPSRKPATRPAKSRQGTPSTDEKIAAAIAGGKVTATDSIPVIAKAAGVSPKSVERWRGRHRAGSQG